MLLTRLRGKPTEENATARVDAARQFHGNERDDDLALFISESNRRRRWRSDRGLRVRRVLPTKTEVFRKPGPRP